MNTIDPFSQKSIMLSFLRRKEHLIPAIQDIIPSRLNCIFLNKKHVPSAANRIYSSSLHYNETLNNLQTKIGSVISLQLHALQTQGIQYNRHGAERHRRPCQPWSQEANCRNGNTNHVVSECPEQVLFDVPHRAPAHLNRICNAVQSPRINVISADGHIRSCSDRHPNIRCSECRRIINAVTYHRDFQATLLKFLHFPPYPPAEPQPVLYQSLPVLLQRELFAHCLP